VNLNIFAGEEFHVKWRHQWREQGGYCSQRYRKREVCSCEIRNHVAGETAWATTDEDNTGSYFRRERKQFGEPVTDKRHKRELAHNAHDHTFWHLQDACEIAPAKCGPHSEHDDLQKWYNQLRQLIATNAGQVLRIIHREGYRREDHNSVCIPFKYFVCPKRKGKHDKEAHQKPTCIRITAHDIHGDVHRQHHSSKHRGNSGYPVFTHNLSLRWLAPKSVPAAILVPLRSRCKVLFVFGIEVLFDHRLVQFYTEAWCVRYKCKSLIDKFMFCFNQAFPVIKVDAVVFQCHEVLRRRCAMHIGHE